MALTRRNFVRAAGLAGAAGSGALLAGCARGAADSGANEPAAAGAAGAGVGPDGVSQVVITMTPSSEPAAGFDPLVGWGAGEHVHEPLIQSTLIATDNNLAFVNDLATDYGCSEDGLTWTFHIREGVMFTDGVPLTAEDVAFTINGIVNGEAAEADLSMVDEARAVDAITCEIAMKRPNNALLYTLAVVGIVPAHAYGPDYGEHPIGSGRYMLEQWDRGQQVILRANPDYYGDETAHGPRCSAVYGRGRVVGRRPVGHGGRGLHLGGAGRGGSRGLRPAQLRLGGFPRHLAALQPRRHRCHRGRRHGLRRRKRRHERPCRAAGAQLRHRPHASMIEHVLAGFGRAAYSVGDGMPWSSEAMRVETDVAAAERLLDTAGWARGDDGMRARDGLPCAFDLYYAAGDSTRQALAYDFADQAAALGIAVEPKGASWDDIYLRQYADPVLWGWGSNSPVELFELTYSTGWGNYAQYMNDTVDANLEAAQAARTVEESYPFYQAAQWDAATETGVAPEGAATWVWLANVDHLYFEREGLKVAEQKPHPHGHGWSLVNNIDQWSWS